MTIILLIFILFVLLTCRYANYNEKYLSKDQTDAVKGIFIFIVFLSHFLSYQPILSNGIIDKYGVLFPKKLGQLMVTLFLFYSGYGLMESAIKKGKNYINKLPTKRILKTLINFDIVVIIYMIATGFLQQLRNFYSVY